MILGIVIGFFAAVFVCGLMFALGGGAAIGDLRGHEYWLEEENRLLRVELAERSQRGEVS